MSMGEDPFFLELPSLPQQDKEKEISQGGTAELAELEGRTVRVGQQIPRKSAPRPRIKIDDGRKIPSVKPDKEPSSQISETLLRRSGILQMKTNQRRVPPARLPPAVPSSTSSRPSHDERRGHQVEARLSELAQQEILFPEESNAKPLSALQQSQEERGPLRWGEGIYNKKLFFGRAQIPLGNGQSVIEEISGVATKGLAERMLTRSATVAKALHLYEPAAHFLHRAQEWVHTTALRQTAEAENVSQFAVIETTNHQVHRIVDADETTLCFEQFGGLSDNRNSYVSLKTLKALIENHELQRLFVQALQDKLAATHSEREKSVLRHVIYEVEHPQEAFAQRHFLLEQQMLIVLFNRIKTASESKTIVGGELHLSHVSQLNPNLVKTEKASGIGHDETTMIEDMLEIFSEFNNKTICFDETEVPYKEGSVIHMPKELGDQGLTLYTHYGNVSTQGSESTAGNRVQDTCNEQMLKEMRASLNSQLRNNPQEPKKTELRLAQAIFERCVEDLTAHRQSFHVAADLLLVQIILGWQVSAGCYSNKDRGGLVGQMLCRLYLAFQKEVASERSEPSARAQLLEEARKLRLYGLQALESKSLQRRVAAYNNAGQTALKVNVLYDIKTPRGLLVAIKNALDVGKDIVLSQIREFCRSHRISIF